MGAAYLLLTKMAKNECEKTVWINDTVELLLQVTSESKASKLHDEVYWESCQLKLADILVIQVFWLNIPQFSEKQNWRFVNRFCCFYRNTVCDCPLMFAACCSGG